LDVIDTVAEDFKNKGIDVYIIQGKTSEKGRKEISLEFRGDPKSKVVIISRAAGESLNLQATNEIILYDIPDGPGAYNQTIGRICRSFSKFENEGRSFYIHYVIVEDTLDVYKPILLSSKKQLEEDILHADTINLKGTGSFDAELLKKIRKDMLWKEKEKAKAKRRGEI
jgi:SNF2 family DNA or RNA helicase